MAAELSHWINSFLVTLVRSPILRKNVNYCGADSCSGGKRKDAWKVGKISTSGSLKSLMGLSVPSCIRHGRAFNAVMN